jgi:hypothetical protein
MARNVVAVYKDEEELADSLPEPIADARHSVGIPQWVFSGWLYT